ncbi:hypothetical protein [Sphingobacterium thalpophilum]|uniref:hypothetical protein n=1 Tax=Sphingobacterium thalpophilum TaxID=259 RepID=UPI003C768E4C
MKANIVITIMIMLQVTYSVFGQKSNRTFSYQQTSENSKFITFNTLDNRGAFFDLSGKLKNSPGLDQTALIQSYFDKYRYIKMPNFPVSVNSRGLQVRSNSVIYFDQLSEIRIIPNASERYCGLCIKQVQNVRLYNPKIIGERDKHQGSSGEWGMGINITSSIGVDVFNPTVRNCWGDGIYIGLDGKILSRDIKIKGGRLDYNRRNGLSIVSGRNIVVDGILISNTYGTKPMSGIDIEPNSNSAEVSDIYLKNIRTVNNFNEGILLYLVNLNDLYKKESNITVINHTDSDSGIGFRISSMKKGLAKANINVSNSNWSSNAKYPFKWGDINKVNFRVTSTNNKADGVPINRKSLEMKIKKQGEDLIDSKSVILK